LPFRRCRVSGGICKSRIGRDAIPALDLDRQDTPRRAPTPPATTIEAISPDPPRLGATSFGMDANMHKNDNQIQTTPNRRTYHDSFRESPASIWLTFNYENILTGPWMIGWRADGYLLNIKYFSILNS
jgi:hypothetical protein